MLNKKYQIVSEILLGKRQTELLVLVVVTSHLDYANRLDKFELKLSYTRKSSKCSTLIDIEPQSTRINTD